MAVNATIAALLLSGAIHSGQPATTLAPGTDAISQPDRGTPTVTLAAVDSYMFFKGHQRRKKGRKSRKRGRHH